MPRTDTADPLDLDIRGKLKFVALVIPVLGVIGGLIRMLGGSEQMTLLVVVPLLLIAFVVSKLPELRETPQEDVRHLRRRQQAEQNRLMQERASTDQLKGMMERHRDEYEAFLRHRSA